MDGRIDGQTHTVVVGWGEVGGMTPQHYRVTGYTRMKTMFVANLVMNFEMYNCGYQLWSIVAC